MSRVVCGVNDQDNEEVGMGVGVPQSFVFSPLLFILVLGAPSGEFCTGVPWELLYAVDLGLIVDTRSVSPSSQRGRLAWKVRGSASTWRRPSSWFLVMAKMSSRNLASIPMLSAAVVSAATPSCAHSACCRSTRSAVAPRSDWLSTETMSAPGVRVTLGPSKADVTEVDVNGAILDVEATFCYLESSGNSFLS